MSSEKTEQPTHKKLQDARKKGQVAKSKDFTQTVLVLALFGYLIFGGAALFEGLARLILMPASLIDMPFRHAADVLVSEMARQAALLLLPILLLVVGLAIFAEMIQTGVLFAFEALKPDGHRIDPVANLKNVFSRKSLVEFVKSILKLSVLGVVVYLLLRAELPTMLTIPQAGVTGVVSAVSALMQALLIHVAIAYAAIALADLVYQRYEHRKELMMSKEEVQREYKEMEGDPHIKHQRRHLHQEVLQEGATRAAAKATVVVTNPTHLAIALRYEEGETPLPVVTAKGEGPLAERMIEAARAAGVPVLQDIPLAHSLMRDAQLDQFIPSDLIEPVAEVLRVVREMTAANPPPQP
jgi:type III secretion protein U